MNDCAKTSGLVALAFKPLPLGSIQPTGWLRNQLRIQADGLTGHLDEFWPEIADSAWIGGSADAGECGPYWLDGVVPLAFLLDDESLKEKVHRWMDYILTHQHEDGWLGPVKHPKGPWPAYFPWPVFVALKAMTQYHSATGEKRVIPAMLKFLRRLDDLLDEQPLFEWSKFRWGDLVLSIHWLYDRTGEPWLLNLAAKVHAQGFDWPAHFAQFPFLTKVSAADRQATDTYFASHVVNNAMAIKMPGVWYRQSHDEADQQAAFHIIDTLATYHGQATGIFTGDEHLAGKNPSQGTELCAVVEYMFSLETLVTITGDAALADRLEQITFNALPATFKPDMWAHQYDQQANQVICRVSEDRIYTNNGPDANIFGLEPNFGCCTANMHQGWPKFASHLWMRSPDGGLVAAAYGPCAVTTDIDSVPVRIDLQTDYPFHETLYFTIEVERPVRFPLRLRIPAWAKGAEVQLAGENPVSVQPGTFHCIDREWRDTLQITLNLPMKVRVQRRYHNSISIARGPLVYALRIGENWKLVGGEPPHGDWEVHPITPWNYALQINEECPEEFVTLARQSIGDCPFSPDGAPVQARVRGRRLPAWTIEHNAAAPPPPSPVRSCEPLADLVLIPYGCTNLRVTEFPTLE